ncbi:MAG: hypothetical protein L0209_04600 [candidate division Zixibacteria bacterium]|nr:hypothetical protein [candidate division Zixibacteria bacterium]
MRKLLIHLLMLVMLTPGLACGPLMGMDKARAAPSMQERMEDCPGMGMAVQEQAPDGNHVFFKDCSKTDLFGADQAVLEKPDLGGKVFLVAWAAIVPAYDFSPMAANAIRGPPPDWPNLSETQPSILLTTQRFRE